MTTSDQLLLSLCDGQDGRPSRESAIAMLAAMRASIDADLAILETIAPMGPELERLADVWARRKDAKSLRAMVEAAQRFRAQLDKLGPGGRALFEARCPRVRAHVETFSRLLSQ
jgi:hypothetical protein